MGGGVQRGGGGSSVDGSSGVSRGERMRKQKIEDEKKLFKAAEDSAKGYYQLDKGKKYFSGRNAVRDDEYV